MSRCVLETLVIEMTAREHLSEKVLPKVGKTQENRDKEEFMILILKGVR